MAKRDLRFNLNNNKVFTPHYKGTQRLLTQPRMYTDQQRRAQSFLESCSQQ